MRFGIGRTRELATQINQLISIIIIDSSAAQAACWAVCLTAPFAPFWLLPGGPFCIRIRIHISHFAFGFMNAFWLARGQLLITFAVAPKNSARPPFYDRSR